MPEQTLLARVSAPNSTCSQCNNGSLLLIEQILGEPNTDPVFSAESDITMMVLLGGEERTRAGFAALLEAADLTLVDTICTPTSFSVLTARPA